MPPTTAARWMITSGRATASIRAMSASRRRSYSRLRGTKRSRTPRWRSASITNEPRKPAPPVTTTRLSTQESVMSALSGVAVPGQIGVDHQSDELGEPHLERPAELLPGLGRVAEEEVDLRRTVQGRIGGDVLAPVEARVGERELHQLLDRVGLSRGHHVVVRLFLLEHEPHRLHVIAGVAPVAPCLEVAEPQLTLEPVLDARHPIGDLARDELEAPPGRLVVEQDPAAGE